MIGAGVPSRVRRHVGEDVGCLAAEHGLEPLRRGLVEEVHHRELDARHLLHRQDVDADDLALLGRADALGRDLAPAAGCRAEVDYPRAFPEHARLVVDLGQLEGGARAITLALCARDVRIVELAFEPQLRGQRALASRLHAYLERARAAAALACRLAWFGHGALLHRRRPLGESHRRGLLAAAPGLSHIHNSEPTRRTPIAYAD